MRDEGELCSAPRGGMKQGMGLELWGDRDRLKNWHDLRHRSSKMMRIIQLLTRISRLLYEQF
jgi:hypothetical protein